MLPYLNDDRANRCQSPTVRNFFRLMADGSHPAYRPVPPSDTIPPMAEYQVRTDVYNGPMDLLLFLIRRHEIDLYDIPVAAITRQYIEYVNVLTTIDPNIAGDFLVLAATLMEIKSRMLLPRPVNEKGEEEDLTDPRLELVRQLLEYKKYKDASFELSAAAEAQAAKWPRVPEKIAPAPPGEVDMDDVQIWDLVAAFNQVMTSIGVRPTTHDVVFDDTPISLHAVDVVDRLAREGGEMEFSRVFVGRSKSEMVGLFLALLELIRQQRVRVTQDQSFSKITVVLLSTVPIEVGDEYNPAAALNDTIAAQPDAPDRPVPGSETEVETDESPADKTSSKRGRKASTSDDEADDELDDEERESFADLDRIKTDVDMDAILKAGAASSADADEEDSTP